MAMGRRVLGILIGSAFALGAALSVAARRPPAEAAAGDTRDFLCPSRLQQRHPELCPQAGLSGELNELAAKGLRPISPLPTTRMNPDLGYVPWDYLSVGEDGATLYPSPQEAADHANPSGRVEGGFVFLSYTSIAEAGGVRVFATPNGYIRGDAATEAYLPPFHGLVFRRTPVRPFGWIISGGTCSERTPGPPTDYSDRCYTKYEVVQIHDVEHVGEWDWYRIAPDEWVEQRMVARVVPDLTPPEGVDGNRWIAVNLYEQTVAAYEDGQLVFATAASTGRNGFWTQPGLFRVWARLDRDDMSGGIVGENFYSLQNVPWVLYFDQARALHGTYWHNRFGTPTSRGCVNLTPADAHWLYDFATEGTWVYVWDPSGQTPTDPSVYGSGGA
jgi:hypothetical protein